MTDTIGGKYTVQGAGRTGRLGTWHTVSTAEGKQRGALRLEDQRLADPTVGRRVAESVRALAALRLPGLLNVIDQVTEGRHSWLIINAAPSPTVEQVLATGAALPPAVAALIATDTAQTLLRLHQAQQAHGDLGPQAVVLSAAGAALLAETGYAHAVAGTTPGPGHDAGGWARLVDRLADGCTDGETRQLLRQAGQQAEAVGGSAGLTAALTTLSAGAQRIPGFGDRGAVQALAAQWQRPAAPVSAPPAATPPAPPPPAATFPSPSATDPAFPPGGASTPPAAEETIRLAEGSHSAPPVPAQAPPRASNTPPTAVMPVVPPVVPPDGATRLGSRAADEQRRAASYQPGRAAPPQAQPAQDVNLRFGQGVPPAPPAWQLAAAQQAPQRRKKPFAKRLMAFLSALTTVALLVVAGFVAWNWWQERNNAVRVVKVSVAPVIPATTECDVRVDVVGTIETDGQAGVITYEWLRSDGQSSGALEQSVKKGETPVQVHLFWRFQGKGSLEATATLRILRPNVIENSSKFTYSCK